MTTSAADIKTAVEMLGPEDIVDGVPKLEAVQRVAGDVTLTAEDVAKAIAADGGTKAGGTETGGKPPAPVIATTGQGPQDGAAHHVDPDADKEDGTGDGVVDRKKQMEAIADAARTEHGQVKYAIDTLDVEIATLTETRKALDKKAGALEVTIEENTVQYSAADMVKRIQQQTQDRLVAQADARKKLAGVMDAAGMKTFASPLDQALALGNKRSIVLQPDGKTFQAPHPRSPEGVRNYGNWVHNGAKRPA